MFRSIAPNGTSLWPPHCKIWPIDRCSRRTNYSTGTNKYRPGFILSLIAHRRSATMMGSLFGELDVCGKTYLLCFTTGKPCVHDFNTQHFWMQRCRTSKPKTCNKLYLSKTYCFLTCIGCEVIFRLRRTLRDSRVSTRSSLVVSIIYLCTYNR